MEIPFRGDFLSRLAVVLLIELAAAGLRRAQAARRRPDCYRFRSPASATRGRLADGH